jgi:hypothetical protein
MFPQDENGDKDRPERPIKTRLAAEVLSMTYAALHFYRIGAGMTNTKGPEGTCVA